MHETNETFKMDQSGHVMFMWKGVISPGLWSWGNVNSQYC